MAPHKLLNAHHLQMTFCDGNNPHNFQSPLFFLLLQKLAARPHNAPLRACYWYSLTRSHTCSRQKLLSVHTSTRNLRGVSTYLPLHTLEEPSDGALDDDGGGGALRPHRLDAASRGAASEQRLQPDDRLQPSSEPPHLQVPSATTQNFSIT